MILLILTLLYFIGLFCFFAKKSGKWGIDLAATSILIAISIFSIVIDTKDLYGSYGVNYEELNFFFILLYCFQWTLVLVPLHLISKMTISEHPHYKSWLLYVLFVLLIITSVYVLVDRISEIRDALVMDMADVYNEHAEMMLRGGNYSSFSIIRLLSDILTAAPFPTFAIFFWFYTKTFWKINIVFRMGLLVVSILQTITSIADGGRAAFVFWFIEFYLIYSFFYPYLKKKTIIWINIAASIFIVLAASIFLAITIARFDTSDRDSLDSLYAYAGQHVNNFCAMMNHGGEANFSVDREMPLFARYVLNQSFNIIEHYHSLHNIGIFTNVFDTFGAELYTDMGWLAYAVFLFLWICGIYYIWAKWNQVIPFYRLFLVIILIRFFSVGMFSWPFLGYQTTMALLLTIAISLFFKFRFKLR